MSIQNKTGGAAFPKLENSYGNAQGRVDYRSADGMTLLDYFAAKAMAALIMTSSLSEGDAANHAYRIASAMIEERKKY